jgi:hypothetical protein
MPLLVVVPTTTGDRARPRAGAGEAAGTGNEEAEEQRETVEMHLEAIAEARTSDTLGRIEPITHASSKGWAGESLAHPSADDWEPAIAADPSEPFVYALITRFAMPACKGGNCPDPAMVLRARGRERGARWHVRCGGSSRSSIL